MTLRRATIAPLVSAARWRLPTARAIASYALLWGTCMQFGACARHADIYDEPDVLVLNPSAAPDSGEIPELDAGLGSDAFPACAQRTVGNCEGPVDFGCRFGPWVDYTAGRCQAATGCQTSGWLQVKLDDQGCVGIIGMDQPNDAMVTCLSTEFTSTRCTCSNIERKYYFGLGNSRDGGGGCTGPKDLP